MTSPRAPDSYLADASSLITLFHRKVSVRKLNALVEGGRLRIPYRVGVELKRKSDKCGLWVRSRSDQLCISETSTNVPELQRVIVSHKDVLTTTKGSADAVIVAMGLYFRDSRTVVSDDIGIQTACYKEGLLVLTVGVFQRLTGI